MRGRVIDGSDRAMQDELGYVPGLVSQVTWWSHMPDSSLSHSGSS
jgi:hypothetical protein